MSEWRINFSTSYFLVCFSTLNLPLLFFFLIDRSGKLLYRIFDSIYRLGGSSLRPGIHTANIFLNYFYLGLLIMCFILALGNWPQGSKWGDTLALVGFGIITVYMTVAALVLAFKGLAELTQDHKGSLSLSDFFTNPIFRNIVLSLSATLGLYVFASLIFVSCGFNILVSFFFLTQTQFEPWHLITSFAQYTLMAPSYINVLNVYAVRDAALFQTFVNP